MSLDCGWRGGRLRTGARGSDDERGGIVASLLGIAGEELLIPTIVLLFGIHIKLAGSLSLAVSLPTKIAGFTRYNRDQSFQVIRFQWRS